MLAFHSHQDSLDKISSIIQYGVILDNKDWNDNTILHIASSKGQLTHIKYLLEDCGNPKITVLNMLNLTNKDG